MKVIVSTSVGGFGDKITKIWGLKKWDGWEDPDKDLLFFGMYHEFDWNMFHHLDQSYKRTIFWCGGDILRLIQNPERQRILKLFEVNHYCETEVEAENLKSVGINPVVIPSFLEDVNDFPISFQPSKNPKIWLCAHPDREEEYGVDVAKRMAKKLPDYTFHIYGVNDDGSEITDNVIYHGVVPNKQFNQEIKNYHCGLRTNLHDGVSEVPMKSVFMGQYPITRLKYDMLWNYETEEELFNLLSHLKNIGEPNLEAREHWIKKINNYPWVKNGKTAHSQNKNNRGTKKNRVE